MWRIAARLYERQTKKIAIGKAVAGCGTTHTALAVANLLASKEKYRVLYLECTDASEDKSTIIRLRTDHVIEVAGQNGFRRSGVDFIPRCLSSDAAKLLRSTDYDRIVMEIDCWTKETAALLALCDRCLMVGCAKPWRYRELQEFLKQRIQESDTMQGNLLLFGLTGSETRQIMSEFDLRAMALPYIQDPYRLTKEEVRALERLL